MQSLFKKIFIKYEEQSLIELCKILLNIYVYSLGISTVLTLVFQIIGGSFRIYSILISVILVTVTIVQFYKLIKIKWSIIGVLLMLLGLFSSVLSYNFNMPNMDDFFYIPNIIHYLDNPNEKMGFEIHYLVSQNPIHSINWGTSVSFEFYQAAITYVLGFEFLDMYYSYHLYWVSFLFPITFYIILRPYLKTEIGTFLSVLVIFGVLFLMGEGARCPGRFFIVRAFQGKSSMLFIFLPYLSYLSFQYLKNNNNKTLFLIFITSIASSGASASSILLIPTLQITIFVTYLISENRKIEWAIMFKYFSTYFLVFLYACYILINETHDLGFNSEIHSWFPKDFLGHFMFLFSMPIFKMGYWIPTIYFPIFGIIAVLLFAEKWIKKEILLWFLIMVVLFANPLTGNYLIQGLIDKKESENAISF